MPHPSKAPHSTTARREPFPGDPELRDDEDGQWFGQVRVRDRHHAQYQPRHEEDQHPRRQPEEPLPAEHAPAEPGEQGDGRHGQEQSEDSQEHGLGVEFERGMSRVQRRSSRGAVGTPRRPGRRGRRSAVDGGVRRIHAFAMASPARRQASCPARGRSRAGPRRPRLEMSSLVHRGRHRVTGDGDGGKDHHGDDLGGDEGPVASCALRPSGSSPPGGRLGSRALRPAGATLSLHRRRPERAGRPRRLRGGQGVHGTMPWRRRCRPSRCLDRAAAVAPRGAGLPHRLGWPIQHVRRARRRSVACRRRCAPGKVRPVEVRRDRAQTVVRRRPPPALRRTVPGGRSSSSCTMTMVRGSVTRTASPAARTAIPDSFM